MGNALQLPTDPRATRLPGAMPGLALVVAVAGACGGSETAPSTGGVAVDTVAGVVRVSNEGPGLWTEEERWSFGPARVRIGELDGADEYVMGRVADVAVGPSGRVYVAESQAKEVRVYSPDGTYLFRFGREGEGPGEFAYLDALQVTPGGEIFVRDPQLSRVSFFDLQGDFLRQFRLERPFFQFQDGTTAWVDRDGRVFDRVGLPVEGEQPFNNHAGLIVYDSVGTVLDTVDAARWRSRNIAVYQGDRARGSFTAPFSLVGAAAVDPEGRVLSGVGDAYRLTLQTLAGDTLAVITREQEARPLSAEDLAWAEERIAEREASLDEVFGGGRMGDVTLPELRPLFMKILVDAAGHWWVGRAHDRSVPVEAWDVFDPDGRYLGVVDHPAEDIDLVEIGDGWAAGIRTDELDVSYAVVLPLVKPEGVP